MPVRSLEPAWQRQIAGLTTEDDCRNLRQWLWQAGLASFDLSANYVRAALRPELLKREVNGAAAYGPIRLSVFLRAAYGLVKTESGDKVS